jgi:hypothetical protein
VRRHRGLRGSLKIKAVAEDFTRFVAIGQPEYSAMYQMKKYTSPGLIPHRPQTMSYQDRPSMYGSPVMSGELSPTDPKPRLRWTAELHERFVDAVNQLGGADSKFHFLPSISSCNILLKAKTSPRQVT